mmetsp:Transcript_4044/g.7788  ORF Transcript_4044/g.7788 Transcript_4044/m.7788 type:complete len:168 (+) Transcript_4044:23-526(+)
MDMGGETLWRIIFVYCEGIGINILLQLWIMMDTTRFLRSYVPLFIHVTTKPSGWVGGTKGTYDLLTHPVDLLLTRSWAYMIIVLGLLEVSILTYGGAPARACFHLAALAGDLMHMAVFGRFIARGHGPMDAGALASFAIASALAISRCCRLRVLHDQIVRKSTAKLS